MKSSEIREKFLKFFESKGHTVVRSSSLVPGNDPTLLFTNSGMVQFKDVFLGQDKRPYVRAASVQRCLRAGGKDNDLENVGYTARHHTFFEMLGNWSFGDYFKKDALVWAWELLTKTYGLPPEKLWATVYQTDDEAYDIRVNVIGLPKERVVRIGDNKGAPYASDNFWQMADTGPCGPCSEIFYDHGPEVAGGPPGSPDADGDRYIEIWNNVFMQFDRQIDPSTGEAKLLPLPAASVDTGMGLERLAAVLQHVHSNYEIDLFQNLIKAAARETGASDLHNGSLRVIADHIRACSFLIVDGVIPGSEGRGYVLRRIIRRALRHGHKLGQSTPFFYKLVPDLVKEMGEAYPELPEAAERVQQVLKQEEERFGETLENGMKILDVALDEAGFAAAMERQKQQARAAGKFKMAAGIEYSGDKTKFVGYESLEDDAKVVALYVGGTAVQQASTGQEAVVVLNTTPFYAESGGQVGDVGVLEGQSALFEVEDTQKIQAEVFGHHGRLVEEIVNREILANESTQAQHMAYDDAIKFGAMALFGEKYGDQVRVLGIGSSNELCGGTHVNRTGDIGLFKIVSESGVAAGIRRGEAVTGVKALELVQQLAARVNEATAAVKTQPEELTQRIAQVQDQVKSLEKELSLLKSKMASSQGEGLAAQAIDINGLKVLAATMSGADVTTLRETMDKLKDKLKTAAIVLAAVNDGKVSLIAGVTKDAIGKVKAGELVNFVAQQVGGKGGGRPDMAQAGGTDPSGLEKALDGVADWVRERA